MIARERRNFDICPPTKAEL